jgi:hypothetical protein
MGWSPDERLSEGDPLGHGGRYVANHFVQKFNMCVRYAKSSQSEAIFHCLLAPVKFKRLLTPKHRALPSRPHNSTKMFRATILLASLLVAAAFGFAPVARVPRASSAALKMSFERELGVLPPIGYWDPLGESRNV